MSVGAPWPPRPAERVEQRIAVDADGSITAFSGKVEYGQGIRTGFAKIVAEELDVAIEHVHVELGETARVPWDMGTFGSLSIATDGKALRAAAAQARHLLLERAGERLRCPASALHTRDGRVVDGQSHAIAYAELVRDGPLTGDIPERDPDHRTVERVSDRPLRLDARDILTGRARYPGDVRLAGLLRGHVLHPPAGARLVRADDTRARMVPGIVAVVRDDDAIGVVAERDDQALAAVHALDVEWAAAPAPESDASHVVLRRDEGIDDTFSNGPTLEARYSLPHIAHASIGPSAAVADVRHDGVDLYVATHRPFAVREDVAALVGLAPAQVRVHPQAMSGMYGRGNTTDAALDAVRLSKAVGRPVLVQWTRDEEFRLSPHRPMLDARVRAVVDGTGTITAWRSEVTTNSHAYGGQSTGMIAMTSGRNAIPVYRLGRAEVLLHVVPAAIRTGAFRSLAAAPNVFAIESFMDELAHHLHEDPIAYRRRHITDARLGHVLEAVRERSGWNTRAAGQGFGVACAIYNRTAVAAVVEVGVNAKAISLKRVWCVVDAGRLVHPDGARNQIEGGIQQAASWTLLEALRIGSEGILTATWRDYPIATINDAPRDIDVTFIDDRSAASSGAGEVGSVPIAAAIANALFDATGTRVRQLPLTVS